MLNQNSDAIKQHHSGPTGLRRWLVPPRDASIGLRVNAGLVALLLILGALGATSATLVTEIQRAVASYRHQSKAVDKADHLLSSLETLTSGIADLSVPVSSIGDADVITPLLKPVRLRTKDLAIWLRENNLEADATQIDALVDRFPPLIKPLLNARRAHSEASGLARDATLNMAKSGDALLLSLKSLDNLDAARLGKAIDVTLKQATLDALSLLVEPDAPRRDALQTSLADLGASYQSLKPLFKSLPRNARRSLTFASRDRDMVLQNTNQFFGSIIALERTHLDLAAQIQQGRQEASDLQNRIAATELSILDEVEAAAGTVITVTLIAVGVAFAVWFVIALWINNTAVRPLRTMVVAIRALAQNKLDCTIPDKSSVREIIAIGAALEVFRNNALQRQELEAKQRADNEAAEKRYRDTETMISAFRTSVRALLSSVTAGIGTMANTADALTGIANNASSRTTNAASASTEASANVESVAAAAEQLAASINDIGEQISRTNQIVDVATNDARETNRKVATLADAAQNIGNVVTLIQDIAERPIFWRSMPRLKRRAQEKPDAVLPWSPQRSRISPGRPPGRPRKSARRS